MPSTIPVPANPPPFLRRRTLEPLPAIVLMGRRTAMRQELPQTESQADQARDALSSASPGREGTTGLP